MSNLWTYHAIKLTGIKEEKTTMINTIASNPGFANQLGIALEVKIASLLNEN